MNSERLLSTLLLLTTLGCAANPGGDVTAPSAVSSSSIAAELRAAGLTVEDAGAIEQPFWTRSAHVLIVAGGDLQIYEFPDAASAERAAAEVAPGGGSIGTSSMAWMAPPHFHRRDRVIAIYIGSDPEALQALTKIMGPQFAGR